MRNLFLILFLFSTLLFSQYYEERTSEQNSEQSDIYFRSHSLNPFGLSGFKAITAGFIDNPFLNLKINPADFTLPKGKDLYLYVDFRGDRQEAWFDGDYVMPMDYTGGYSSVYLPDRRWITVSREEPEPIISFGIILRPLSEVSEKFFVGGSYQFLRKNENYYDSPYGVYYYRYYYDSFGAANEIGQGVPVTDRYSGADEMTNVGHFLSFFTGYEFSDELKAGIGINGVIHSKEGEYSNSYNGEYGSSNTEKWNSFQSEERAQDYKHIDLSLGVKYSPLSTFALGLKAGYLNGKGNQSYSYSGNNLSERNKPGVSSEWYYYFYDASTSQNWEKKGGTVYGGLDFQKRFKEDKVISGYYLYSSAKIDLTTNSVIKDTSNHNGRWVYNQEWYNYSGYSALSDIRTGTGERNIKTHEGMVNLKWKLNDNTTLSTGIYINNTNTKITSTEPASVYRVSSNSSATWQGNYNNYFQSRREEKTLVWEYMSDFTTIQIPVLLYFRLSDQWELMTGISRIANAWDIEDVTTAYFTKREKTDLDTSTTELNFGERYKMPRQRISEDLVKFLMSLKLNISDEFSARVMFEPEFDPYIRIAQWWFAIEANL
ncbi:MAG: hypothetical protein AB9882_10410 [Ignavibacteriaceae bacterium]